MKKLPEELLLITIVLILLDMGMYMRYQFRINNTKVAHDRHRQIRSFIRKGFA